MPVVPVMLVPNLRLVVCQCFPITQVPCRAQKTLIDKRPKDNLQDCQTTAMMLHPQIVSFYVIQQSDQAAVAACLRILPTRVRPQDLHG